MSSVTSMNDDYYRLTDAAAAFLRARLAESEAAANAATPGQWHKEPPWAASPAVDPGPGFAVVMNAVGETVVAIEEPAWEGERAQADAAHIALNNPDAALTSAAADRALLSAYEQAGNVAQPDPADSGYLQGLALAVRCRAAAWSGHKDYRPEWAPWPA